MQQKPENSQEPEIGTEKEEKKGGVEALTAILFVSLHLVVELLLIILAITINTTSYYYYSGQ